MYSRITTQIQVRILKFVFKNEGLQLNSYNKKLDYYYYYRALKLRNVSETIEYRGYLESGYL